jgi:hypothetical protein
MKIKGLHGRPGGAAAVDGAEEQRCVPAPHEGLAKGPKAMGGNVTRASAPNGGATQQREVRDACKNHIPSDLVVDQWVSNIESSSPRDVLFLHDLWTTCRHLLWSQITSVISTAWDFTTKSGGICIAARTKEALARRKAQGLPLGRPKSSAARVKLDSSKDQIGTYLQKDVSKRSIARILECSPSTLYAWLRRQRNLLRRA